MCTLLGLHALIKLKNNIIIIIMTIKIIKLVITILYFFLYLYELVNKIISNANFFERTEIEL